MSLQSLCLFLELNDGRNVALLLYVDNTLIAGLNMHDIKMLKRKLSSTFAMKDLGATKQIFDMCIIRDKTNQKLILSLSDYVEKVLESNAKLIYMPLASHFRLCNDVCPKT